MVVAGGWRGGHAVCNIWIYAQSPASRLVKAKSPGLFSVYDYSRYLPVSAALVTLRISSQAWPIVGGWE